MQCVLRTGILAASVQLEGGSNDAEGVHAAARLPQSYLRHGSCLARRRPGSRRRCTALHLSVSEVIGANPINLAARAFLLGYVEGQNLVMERRSAHSDDGDPLARVHGDPPFRDGDRGWCERHDWAVGHLSVERFGQARRRPPP
jgi:hypothetical protein